MSAPLAKFSAKWCHPDYLAQPVPEAELAAAEAALGAVFPQDYRAAMLETGPACSTRALLHNIVELELNFPDLAELSAPAEVAAFAQENWQAGAPEGFLMIGSDSLGNQFGYVLSELKAGQGSPAPIHYWDHDFDMLDEIAPSFNAWIEAFIGPWSDTLTYADFE